MLNDIKGSSEEIKKLPATLKALREENSRLIKDLSAVRRSVFTRPSLGGARHRGFVSDECARKLAATFIHHCERSGRLEALSSFSAQRDKLLTFAHDALGIAAKTALNTSDIPLPSEYGSELRELISDFGVVRRRMSPYPIGMGTSRPARMGTRPSFGSIAMSAAFSEKSPTI